MLLKSCPNCNRTYSDETQSFCLIDGSVLSAPYDPQKTLKLHNSLPPNFKPTNIPPTQKVYSFDFNDLLKPKQKITSRIKWYWYVFGVILSPALFFSNILLHESIGTPSEYMWTNFRILDSAFTSVPLTYALLGLGFGYFFPNLKWKWGMLLSVWVGIVFFIIFVDCVIRFGLVWSNNLSESSYIFISILVSSSLGSLLGALVSSYKESKNLNPESKS